MEHHEREQKDIVAAKKQLEIVMAELDIGQVPAALLHLNTAIEHLIYLRDGLDGELVREVLARG